MKRSRLFHCLLAGSLLSVLSASAEAQALFLARRAIGRIEQMSQSAPTTGTAYDVATVIVEGIDYNLRWEGEVGPGTLLVNPQIYKGVRYRLSSFEPVIALSNFTNLVVVSPRLGVNNATELVALAKQQPGKLNFGSSGHGNLGHFAGDLAAAGVGLLGLLSQAQRLDLQLMHAPLLLAGLAPHNGQALR